ncbi:hypothetical protein MRS44_018521 [Fusarium solani]|uniref:uncharacterized protein n=1 Tax=Fusarium solani TaxID=169388 RepID=UPI0032C465E2|nr:hypothetical protein MRS44_018521 [Fusarium solani]
MSVCVPRQQLLAAGEVALALRSAEGAPPWETSQSPSNVAHHDEPSSNTERAADDANEPQAGGYPNSPAKPAANKRKRGDDDDSSSKEGKRPVLHCALGHADDSDAESTSSDPQGSVFDHDEHDSYASSAASDVADGRDGEPMNPNSYEDATSDFADDSDADSTSSLDSECLKYVQENGRRYHADLRNGYEYFHAGWLCFYEGKLYSAPIENVQSVLDIGTGTGIWAIARVIGTDISPIQPTCVPPSLEFQFDDCNLESTFGGEHFDFIHVRGMAGCISNCDAFAKRQFDDLKPGGYLEYKDLSMRFQSDDESLKDYNYLNKWGKFWKDVGTKLNRPLTIAEDGTVEKAMERVGFTNIKRTQGKVIP